jgi:hypothetical protein
MAPLPVKVDEDPLQIVAELADAVTVEFTTT